jgi:hypothetical protein
MKTQITKQHTNVVAVQPQTTFHKEDRMKKHSSPTLKLAILFAMVLTMAFPAAAQVCVPGSTYCNPLQVALKAWYPANNTIKISSFRDSAGTFHTLSSPSDMAFDGENIWISETSANRVWKVRASDGQFQASYAVPSPGSLAFDGQRIWANQQGGTTVNVIFASDGSPAMSPINTIGINPKSLAFDSWAMWEVTDGSVGRILSWSGGGYYCYLSTGNGNTGVAWDGKQGVAYVSNSTGSVTKYNGACQVIGTPIAVAGGPVGIVFDGTNMWTANAANGKVARITPAGGVSYYDVGGSPQQIAFDGGNIWVTLGSGGTVKKLAAFGSSMGTVSAVVSGCATGAFPVGLAFDGASMWVTCPASSLAGKM